MDVRLRSALLPLAVALVAATPALSAPSPEEILRKAFEAANRNEELTRDYTFHRRDEERKLDKGGQVKGIETKKYDVTFLYGDLYERLIERDDKPLEADDAAKEQKKFDKSVEKRANESEKAKQKRLEKKKEEEERFRKIREETLLAFEFRLVGEETVAGAPVWVIEGEPKPDYEPKDKRTKFLTKMRGKLWIAQEDYGLARMSAVTIDSASFGWFLLKLKEGAEIEFEQRKLNDEVWLPDAFRLRFSARVLVKGLRREVLLGWDNFRKFATESKIVAGGP